ncbi:MAG: asparagine synthase (glutamine-hydrolyzing) [Elusimicrobia bacterium]|nr:asparagine synthase (glutamine-hydrolyzing) [Elusimicrobiota bacterium]
MCGIAGIARFDSPGPLEGPDRDVLGRMTDILTHRGPDDRGTWLDGGCGLGLGHRRLSILDLSPAGRQPMASGDGAAQIVYNGEIYNYLEVRRELEALGERFRSGTDTEVILAAYLRWGERCVERFNGMWSFAVWDGRQKRLFLSRDRFGVKPLYYFSAPGIFLFASEIKALLLHPEVPRRPNLRALYQFLATGWGYVEVEEETMFAGVRQLLPGHNLSLRGGTLEKSRYWSLPLERKAVPEAEAIETFTQLFEDAVRLRLRSDVPVGTCLSGGLDSSAVTWAVKRFRDPGGDLETFSSRSSLPEYDEGRYIRSCAESLGAANFPAYPAGRDVPAVLPKLLWHHDTPYAGASVFAQWEVMRTARERGFKVLMSGQGADEVLGGYLKFLPFRLAGLLGSGRVTDAVAERSGMLAAHSSDALRLPWLGLLRLWGSWAVRKRWPTASRPPCRSLDYVDTAAFPRQEGWIRVETPPTFSPLQAELYRSLTVSPLPAILRNDDRNGMAHSIELRSPFLDYRLVSFCFGLPDDLKVQGPRTKHLLRRYLAGRLPEIAARPDKKGFLNAAADWFRDELYGWARDIVSSRSFRERGVFRADRVMGMLERHRRREGDFSLNLWCVVNVELWHQAFFDRGEAARPT